MARACKQSSARSLTAALAAAALTLLLAACGAATRPVDPAQPRSGEPPYPVLLASSDERTQRALANWGALLGEQTASAAPTPELRPVTATVSSLPAGIATSLRLPRVIISDEAELSEEEARESLRRFIASAAPLLGVAPGELSLTEVTDEPGGAGTRRARYRQRPFSNPLRNGYGVIEIVFTPDLRVVELSSTAIPDTERLRLAVRAVTPKLTTEQAVSSLANRAVSYTDREGNAQTLNVTPGSEVAVRELVVFPVRPTGGQELLELHLAWELSVGGAGTPLLVYVDAVSGALLGASPSAQTANASRPGA